MLLTDRLYRRIFDQETTRLIHWELNLAHPAPDSRTDYAIQSIYQRSDGSILRKLTQDAHLEEDSTLSLSTQGSGSIRAGAWPLGTYAVDLMVDGELVASGRFVVKDRPNAGQASYLELKNRLPWSTTRLSYEQRRDLKTLSILTRDHPSVAAGVASLSWVQRGVNSESRGALEYLTIMADQDPELAAVVARLPWVEDGITQEEIDALKFLTLLSGRVAPLAQAVATFPWARDQISQPERQALEYLHFFALEESSIARRIAGFPWVADGLTKEELSALEDLRDLAVLNVSISRSLTRYQWISDGIARNDRSAITSLKQIANGDPSLAIYIAGHPWVSDDITTLEAQALNSIKDLHAEEPSLASAVAGSRWFVDGLTEPDRSVLQNLEAIVTTDNSVALALATLPWLKFGLSQEQRRAISELSDLLVQDPTLAKQVVAMPFFTSSFETRDKKVLSSLLLLSGNFQNVLTLLVAQEWFIDGVDDQDAALVNIAGTPTGPHLGPNDFRALLQKHHGESRTAAFPRSQGFRLTFFQPEFDPKSREIIDQFEDAGQLTEDLMGVPFPGAEVVFLFASAFDLELDLDFNFFDFNRGNHIVLDPHLPDDGATTRIVIHHVAHFYWGPPQAPLWFREGAADFLAARLGKELYGGSRRAGPTYDLGNALELCDGLDMTTIQKLIDQLAIDGYAKHEKSSYFTCHQHDGENLFNELFETLGSGPFFMAWKDLYQLSQREARPVSETEIYQAFLRHATEEGEDEFEEVFRRLHGGSFSNN